MPKRSAGILMFRRRGEVEVLLMHPGGPFWAKKDLGAWSIPKGEYSEDEDALAVAKREFEEETGARPQGDFLPLGEVVQRGRKIVTAWGLEGDRAQWFSLADARRKMVAVQGEFITRLLAAIGK